MTNANQNIKEDDLIFMDEISTKEVDDNKLKKWKIITADDEEEILNITEIALRGFTFKGKGVELIRAYSGEETKQLIEKYPDTAIILLDVVMETDNAGLEVVDYIRSELKNNLVQIILRTGQPGQAPEQHVIEQYEINDYKSKSELTAQKLFTTVTSSLRTYDLASSRNQLIQQLNDELTERKRTEEKVRELSQFQKIVIDSADIWLNALDNDLNVILWNKAAEKISGYSWQEVLEDGKMWELLYRDNKYRSEIKKTNNEVVKEGKVLAGFETTIRKKDGETAVISWNSRVLKNENDEPIGSLCLGQDITEKRGLENQLRQAQKMETVGTLAGGLAHDFNNVLGGIIGTLSLIKFILQKDESIDDEELLNYLNIMEEAGQRAANMVQQLLSLSRKQDLSFVPVDLNLSIKHVIKICQNSFDKSIELNPHYDKKPAMVNADMTQIEQVLLNLCVNASHSMTTMRQDDKPWGGTLDIMLDRITAGDEFCSALRETEPVDYWVLSVKDSGIGMDSQLITKIFDPFFTTKGKGEGTGLGLAMVYNIVKQHNGVIDVVSEIGIGTTFKVYLPLLKDETALKSKEQKNGIPQGEGLILVIDDENMIRKTVKAILERCGYEVILAENGEEGIKIFKERYKEIKAILLDMVMPKLSGKETFMKLKDIDPGLKVLLASGFMQDERVEKLQELGIKDFIQKPYTMDTIAVAIDRIIKED
ncbi:MAG: response regulator [bacterium]|nr:response regulator [bacterium]